MKNQFIKRSCFALSFMLLLALTGCEEKDFQSSRSNDESELSSLKYELEAMAGQNKCNANTEWGIMTMVSSSCSGPIGYLAYDKKVDVQELAQKLAAYIRKKDAFDIKWNKGPVCSMVIPPKSVACVDGKAKLVY